ncbi:hypothetical protein AY601_4462 [Pedobacter cryoconitis]|uniref:DUF4159 domain-containing protein n=1 Tax=Pedobacter cryoconitis TaxID=188932 RepID=A0A127VJ57_9SPHI|nr:DUF4159 domain-containing protein [Pedobacter cryoconitis]AMQ01302.1 hypothetical protein AY601_4462 [Pedobacter cryoconitis]
MKFKLLTFFPLLILLTSSFNTPAYQLARLKYSGGGDWYGNRTALVNLAAFCNQNLRTNFAPEEAVTEAGSPEIFNYPFVYMTGHGNVVFSAQEAQNIRRYLIGGGFLHIDDNYGLDKYVRVQMKKVFPELSFIELPANHPIYNEKFKFPNGLPKIHEHDGKRAQGFALLWEGRIICYYTYECDLGNGWEDFGTYPGDTAEKRSNALKMGANLVSYVLTH